MTDFITDKGLISTTDGKLALSEYTGSSVSDFMGYGSYSGSDINVMVHYPKSTEVQKLIERKRVQLNYDLLMEEQKKAIGQRANAAVGIASKKQETISNSRISALQAELMDLDKQEENIKNLPTSKKLAELHTLSWSTFRENAPVRTLGSIYPRSIVKGSRTIAGSMIFTIFHQHVLHEILSLNLGIYNTGTSDHDPYRNSTNLPDQLPPLDISIVFANEYGAVSHMGLYGVQFFQEGATFSIEDIFSESVLQYSALDIDPIRVVGTKELDNKGVTNIWTTTASQLPYQKDNPVSHRTRRNPFF